MKYLKPIAQIDTEETELFFLVFILKGYDFAQVELPEIGEFTTRLPQMDHFALSLN